MFDSFDLQHSTLLLVWTGLKSHIFNVLVMGVALFDFVVVYSGSRLCTGVKSAIYERLAFVFVVQYCLWQYYYYIFVQILIPQLTEQSITMYYYWPAYT